MNNSELAIKYSNENYCTKKEVIEELRTPMVDSIWNSILEYRSNFSVVLGLKHINSAHYSVCLTPVLNNKISGIDRKILKCVSEYMKIENFNEKMYFRVNSYTKVLKIIAKRYNLDVEDSVIENIVNKNTTILSPELMVLNRYYQSLLEIENDPYTLLDNDVLSKYYSLLMGCNKDEVAFRKQDVDSALNKTLINRLYLGIPAQIIENNMKNLLDFINNSDLPLFIKSLCSFYFIYYVKPFENYTEEVSTLLFKKVLAQNNIGDVAALLNFEALFGVKDELELYILESQKTYDLTYLINYVVKKTDTFLDSFLDNLAEIKRISISEEIDQQEETNVLNYVNNNSNIEEKNIVNNQTEKRNRYENIGYNQNVAISNMPTGLNEDEATKLENHLMELNPNLSHGQAYFYARHCTLGMSYTIAQYKKALGCAYETARTSMDHLVYLGYYRKEALKNKFIYTPVKKG